MTILVTGAAGFIGFHLCKKLIEKKIHVIGIDNLNNYYSVKLKKDRINFLKKHKNSKYFSFKKLDLRNVKLLNNFLNKKKNQLYCPFSCSSRHKVFIKESKKLS